MWLFIRGGGGGGGGGLSWSMLVNGATGFRINVMWHQITGAALPKPIMRATLVSLLNLRQMVQLMIHRNPFISFHQMIYSANKEKMCKILFKRNHKQQKYYHVRGKNHSNTTYLRLIETTYQYLFQRDELWHCYLDWPVRHDFGASGSI